LTLLLGLLAIATLGASVAHATATTQSPAAHVRAAATSEEEEYEAEEAEETDEAEDEEEIEVELEYEESEEAQGAASLPPECTLRTVEPAVLARFTHGDLRLSVRYTSDAAGRVSVAYWLKGAKGTARLGAATRRLGLRGVMRMSRHVDDRTLAKLRAARVVVVQLDVAGMPGSCKRRLTMRLTAQRLLARSAIWSKPA
jgi:hypothetical protein